MRKSWILGVIVVMVLAPFTIRVHADTITSDFESPTYSLGSINNQDGWKAGNIDQAVVANTFGFSSFGGQTLRISNAITSDSASSQVFAKPLSSPVGETQAEDLAQSDACNSSSRQTHLDLQFDIASASPTAQQKGLAVVVAPVRNDGEPMSYLRFEDGISGIDIYIKDYSSAFHEARVVTGLSRSVTHTVKLTMDTPDGPSNDLVRLFVDNNAIVLVNSWENYYFSDIANAANPFPPVVNTAIFQSVGTANPTLAGQGFIFDNVSLISSVPGATITPPPPPSSKDQCKKGGWQTFCNPKFKNQGDCVSYIEHQEHDHGQCDDSHHT